MSLEVFKLFYGFLFIWCAAGMLFIAVACIKDIFFRRPTAAEEHPSRPESNEELTS